MAPILYHQDFSPPSRAVRIVAEYLNIPLELKVVDLTKQEHLNPEFIKVNPQHTLPTLDDNGFVLWESHAIIEYLISKYVPNGTNLFPSDIKLRALVQQRQQFDSGVLFAKLREIFLPLWLNGAEKLSDDRLKDLENDYGFLEAFLGANKYLVGNQLTVADISCSTTINMLRLVKPIDQKKFPKLREWMNRVISEPTYAKIDAPGQESCIKSLTPYCKNDKIVPEL